MSRQKKTTPERLNYRGREGRIGRTSSRTHASTETLSRILRLQISERRRPWTATGRQSRGLCNQERAGKLVRDRSIRKYQHNQDGPREGWPSKDAARARQKLRQVASKSPHTSSQHEQTADYINRMASCGAVPSDANVTHLHSYCATFRPVAERH